MTTKFKPDILMMMLRNPKYLTKIQSYKTEEDWIAIIKEFCEEIGIDYEKDAVYHGD